MSFQLRAAAAQLRAGGLVAYPTESVFGLGCDPLNPAAVARLLALKARPVSKGLILLAGDFAALRLWMAPLSDAQLDTLGASWPGPVTWLVPAAPYVPAWLTGGSDRIALRYTAQPVAAELSRSFGGAIVSTSANVSGRPPALDAIGVRRRFRGQVDSVVAGATGGARHVTEIRDLLSGEILRPA